MRKVTKLVLLGIVCSLLLVSCLVYAIYKPTPTQVKNYGKIRVIGVEIFQDANLVTILEQIPWGTLDPNETKTYQAWILNTGNDDIKLLMWTDVWVPANASNWISLSWNYTEQVVAPNDSILVEFVLFVDPNIAEITNFSFDIWIMGVKVE